jgi:hypothetical protein
MVISWARKPGKNKGPISGRALVGSTDVLLAGRPVKVLFFLDGFAKGSCPVIPVTHAIAHTHRVSPGGAKIHISGKRPRGNATPRGNHHGFS